MPRSQRHLVEIMAQNRPGVPYKNGKRLDTYTNMPRPHSHQPTSPVGGAVYFSNYGGEVPSIDQHINDAVLLTPHASAPGLESSPYYSHPPTSNVNPPQFSQTSTNYNYDIYYPHNVPTIPVGPTYQDPYLDLGSTQLTDISTGMPIGMGHLQPFGQTPESTPTYGYGDHPSPFNVVDHRSFSHVAPPVSIPRHPPVPALPPQNTYHESTAPSKSKEKPKRSVRKRNAPRTTSSGTLTPRDFVGPPPTPAETDDYLRRWFKGSKNVTFPPNVSPSLDGLPDGPVGKKPPFTLQELIALAIWSSPTKRLTLREILWALKKRFKFLHKTETHAEQAWERSIRHRLSLKAMFVLENRDPDEPGKGGWWSLDIRGGNNETRPKAERKKGKKQADEYSDVDDGDIPQQHTHRRSNSPYEAPSNKKRGSSSRHVNASSRNSSMSARPSGSAVTLDWATPIQHFGPDDIRFYIADSPPSDTASLPTPETMSFSYPSSEPNTNMNIRHPARGHTTEPIVGYTHTQAGSSRAAGDNRLENTHRPSYLNQANHIVIEEAPQGGVEDEGNGDDFYV